MISEPVGLVSKAMPVHL